MEVMQYPKIGTKVSFIRQNFKTQEVEEGVGLVLAICLDQNKRLMAHLEIGDTEKEKVNVDLKCLEPSEEFKEEFKGALKAIREMSDDANKKIASMVAEGNERVESVYNAVLGEPIVF